MHLIGFWSDIATDIDIILGDFNIDLLNENSDVNMLRNLLSGRTYAYRQIIDESTHIDGGLLDHVFTKENMFHLFDVSKIKICVNISDHDALKIKINLKNVENEMTES